MVQIYKFCEYSLFVLLININSDESWKHDIHDTTTHTQN